MADTTLVDAFIEAGSVAIGAAHASGGLAAAERIRLGNPDIARASIHAAAVAGDEAAVREWLDFDASLATTPGGPRNWAPLVYLCFSRYLRLDPARSEGFVGAAHALLDTGADANGGFFDASYSDRPEWECVLYGAAGVAHHEGLTRLLLAHGADPNDGEVTYHVSESRNLGPIQALLDSGRLSADSLAVMLARKHDWHDLEGVRLLLAHGADPNRRTGWGITPLHQAVRRDNAAVIVEALLARGGDPHVPIGPPAAPVDGRVPDTALTLAAWRGRADLLASFEAAGARIDGLHPRALVAACAREDARSVRDLASALPDQAAEVAANAGELLCLFAGNGNVAGIRCLAGLGLRVDATWPGGDGYFEVPRNSTALHVAAWRARHDAVRALVDLGAPVDAADGAGRTALVLAVRACVDSHWQAGRRPDSIATLLASGADTASIVLPTGYDEADRLIAARRDGC